jgi:N6-L-threonylcarbamoyladenine synthase
MRVLGIETSCDETAAAVVEDGRIVHANVVASQIAIHERYGGVVPEVASRAHLQTIIPVIESAVAQAGGWERIDAVGATYGPGLAGALLVGLSAAKAVAFGRGLPFIGVNHLEGHIYANWLKTDEAHEPPEFPALCLVVSGGHTDLIMMEGHGRYRRLGRTRDDAAGEAFDKVARLLDLGFPGGPAIERAARTVGARTVALPRAWLPGTHDFSFSGLKTAVLHLTREPERPPAAEIAAAFQDSVIEVLATKTARAAEEHGVRHVLMAGGVASNTALREALAAASPVPVRYPPPRYCTDNAAMIAAAAYFHLVTGERSAWDLDVQPNLRFAQ